MKKHVRFNFSMIIIIILSVLLISITIYAIKHEKEETAEAQYEKIYVGCEENEPLDNFSKEDAVSSMQNILLSIDEDVEDKNRTIAERIEELDKEDTDLADVINEKTIKMLYLHDEFESVKFNRQFTASALLTYRELIKELSKNDNIQPSTQMYDELVYLDTTLMRAHIPIDIFTGENKGIAFEMQYVDGEWKFNPYTSMMSLVMIVNYENQIRTMSEE